MIAAGYMLPTVVIIGCMIVAGVMACNPVPPLDEDEGLPVIEEEVSGWLKEQRGTLKFLASLVVCWVVGNSPLIYFMRGSPSMTVEAALILVVIGHQLALPIATLVWRRRLWSRLRRFLRSIGHRKPRTVGHSGSPTECPSDEETPRNASGVDGRSRELPGPSSVTDGDGQDSRSAHDGISKGRCVKFDREAVRIHLEGHQRLEDVAEEQDLCQPFCSLTAVSTTQSSSGKLSTTTQNCDRNVCVYVCG